MNEDSRYAVGIDIGSTSVRCVAASLDNDGKPTVVGVGVAENSGMKKGTVANLASPAKAIDDALGEVERMSGCVVDFATVSINGAHILSTKSQGMIAVSSAHQEVSDDDIARIEQVATIGKIPANREILNFIPYSYILDGQDGISDPFGMKGSRLEVQAIVVSALTPYLDNLHRALEMATLKPNSTTVGVLAAARAVLDEKQMESGVAVIDLGSTTTGVAIYEDGDLQYVRVLPVGGVNITNDLAIGLKVSPEVAEEVKLQHGTAIVRDEDRNIALRHGKEHYSFNISEIDEIIEARLEEIFEAVRKEFKRAGRDKKLPSGVVLTGGGANMRKIAEFAKKQLELAAKVGEIKIESAISDEFRKPEFATAVGLMLEDAKFADHKKSHHEKTSGFFAKLFKKNKVL